LTAFLKNIFHHLRPAKPKDTPPEIRLAAFGKHPGWDDHMEDLGLDTPRLIAVKDLLYVRGIGSNIDAGAWDKLPAGRRIDGFNHAFIWHWADEVVLGRFWSSRDGKGRTHYPMVVCLACTGLPLGWVLEHGVGFLEDTRQQCQAVASAAAVRAIFSAGQARLTTLLAEQPREPPDPFMSAQEVRALARRPEMGDNQIGFLRICHQMDRGFPGFWSPTSRVLHTPPSRSEQLRLPVGQADAYAAANQWIRFLSAHLRDVVGILALWPLGGFPWLDVIAGDPSASQLLCLRCTLAAIPLTTDIPFNVDPKLGADVGQFLAGV
jgi:hypothetical protein